MKALAGGAFALLLVMVAMLWLTKKPDAVIKPMAALATRPAQVAPAAAPATPAMPVYRHSVVPGGVHSVADLKAAIARDPVVKAHYAGFNVDAAHVVTLDQARMVHVSYRIGDQIYWTRNKVRLAEGETLISDGEHLIRSRCGNLVADEPQGLMRIDDAVTEELDAAFVSADDLAEQTPNLPLDAAGMVGPNNASARGSSADASQAPAARPYPASMFNMPGDLRAPAIPLTTIAFLPPAGQAPGTAPALIVPAGDGPDAIGTPPAANVPGRDPQDPQTPGGSTPGTTPPGTTPPAGTPPASMPPDMTPPGTTPPTATPPGVTPPGVTPPTLTPPTLTTEPPLVFAPPPTTEDPRTPPVADILPEVIPEPHSGILFTLALGALLLVRRRANKAALP